jgi:hypothetical protein
MLRFPPGFRSGCPAKTRNNRFCCPVVMPAIRRMLHRIAQQIMVHRTFSSFLASTCSNSGYRFFMHSGQMPWLNSAPVRNRLRNIIGFGKELSGRRPDNPGFLDDLCMEQMTCQSYPENTSGRNRKDQDNRVDLY